MYHFVNSESDSILFSGMHGVKEKDFEKQLKNLLKSGCILTEADIKDAAFKEKYPNDDHFYLTFDDGFKQHFDNVYPLLKDYGIHGSFFVPSMALETGKIPLVEKQRVLQYNLFTNYEEFLNIFCSLVRAKFEKMSFCYPSDDNVRNCRDYLKEYTFYSDGERYFRKIRNEYLNNGEFQLIINEIFEKFYSTDYKFINEYYLSIQDLKTMQKNGMVIGGHTYSHPFLNKLPVNQIKHEVEKGMVFLRNKVDKDINSFAYPFGAFNDNVIKCLKQSGIDYAFDTRTEGPSTRFNIRRNDPATFFKN
jgi:peptidoglycan/xylan/chitin deacetylase (PgdA/CDA1 family)